MSTPPVKTCLRENCPAWDGMSSPFIEFTAGCGRERPVLFLTPGKVGPGARGCGCGWGWGIWGAAAPPFGAEGTVRVCARINNKLSCSLESGKTGFFTCPSCWTKILHFFCTGLFWCNNTKNKGISSHFSSCLQNKSSCKITFKFKDPFLGDFSLESKEYCGQAVLQYLGIHPQRAAWRDHISITHA